MTEILLRVTVLLLAAMLVALALRRASAALRHLVWTLSLVGALLIPLCSFALPAWQWAILPPRTPSPQAVAPADEERAGGSSLRSTPPYDSPQGPPAIRRRPPNFSQPSTATASVEIPATPPVTGHPAEAPSRPASVLACAAGRGLGGREFRRACLARDRRRGGLVCCPAGQAGRGPGLAVQHAATARPVRHPPADCRPRVPSRIGPHDLGALSAGDSRSGRKRVVVGRGQAERAAARVRAYPPRRLPDAAHGPAGLRGVLVPSASLAGGQAVAEDERAGGRRPGAGLEHRAARLCRASRGDRRPDARASACSATWPCPWPALPTWRAACGPFSIRGETTEA